ncbi:MAG: hypothetical protein LH645_05255 [Actinomycetia bacterium]|nr:hypothetical protein [Actinomycetes bacterium]
MTHGRAAQLISGATEKRWTVIAYLVVSTLAIAIAVPAALGSSPARVGLNFSLSADHSNAGRLVGMVDRTDIYVFATVPGATEVRFWVDRPGSGTPDHTAVAEHVDGAPVTTEFDMLGATQGTANPWHLAGLSAGDHQVIALAQFSNGFSISTTTKFKVSGSAATGTGDQPPLSPTPSPSASSSAPPSPPPSSTPTPTPSTASPTPTPTPSPSPTTNTDLCASNELPPPLTGYPDAETTGVPASAQLKKIDGDLRTTQNGQVISNVEITGRLYIDHDNVTVKCSRVWGGTTNTHSNFRMWLSTLGNPQGVSEGSALKYSNYTLRRVEILGTIDGLKAEGNVDVRDTWIHDLFYTTDSAQTSGMTHNDSVQATKGSHMVFQHNRFDTWSFAKGQVAGTNTGKSPYGDGSGYQTSAFMLVAGFGNISDVVIADNIIRGRAAKYVFALDKNGYTTTGVRIVNNTMGVENRDYPQWFGVNSATTVSGNVAVK